MSNKTYRVFAEKLGGVDASSFIANEGELFWDPTTTTLRVGDDTAGGQPVSGSVLSNVYVPYDTNYTPLDLTKQINVLDPVSNYRAYQLDDGVEGQIMYFVLKNSTDTEQVGIHVVHSRYINGSGIVNEVDGPDWFPFRNADSSAISYAIFTDGRWNLSSNQFD